MERAGEPHGLITRTRVKICCIASLDEASLALGSGADVIGLVSAMPSGPGPIADERIAEIAGAVPQGTRMFLLTSRTDPAAIAQQVRDAGVPAVQIVDRLAPGALATLRGLLPGIELVQVIHVGGEESLAEAIAVAPHVDAILLDSGNQKLAVKELGGTGRTHDWTVSRRIRESVRVPVWLAGGLNAHNVGAAIAQVQPHGVDICSGVRTEGRLDPARLTEFLAAVRAAEAGEPQTGATALASPVTPVKRHHWIVRLTHWVNTVVLVGMIASGLQIYGAYPRFGLHGTRLGVPNPFDQQALPHWARLGGWLAGGLNWHFFLMWPLILNGLLYLIYLLVSGEGKILAFRPRDVPRAVQMQLYYLKLRKDHPPQGKHNALQKAAYSFIVVLGVLSVLSGIAIWKPVQLGFLTALFGGYEWTRYWHFAAVWLFTGFILVHVALVFLVDPASLRAMITGWYRGRFPSEGA